MEHKITSLLKALIVVLIPLWVVLEEVQVDNTLKQLKIRIISLNFARKQLRIENIESLLTASVISEEKENAPDIIAICFQERLATIRSPSDFRFQEQPINASSPLSKYELVEAMGLLQTEVIVLKRKTEALKTSDVRTGKSVFRSFSTFLTQKGGVGVSFTVNSLIRVNIVGLHLLAHLRQFFERAYLKDQITKDLVIPAESHLTFFVGDTNSRIDLGLGAFQGAKYSYEAVRDHYRQVARDEGYEAKNIQMLKELIPAFADSTRTTDEFRGTWEQLSKFDQISFARKERIAYHDCQEPLIEFQPTYKKFKGEDRYDTRARTPSWTDRILLRSMSSNASFYFAPAYYRVLPQVAESDHGAIALDTTIFLDQLKNAGVQAILSEYEYQIDFNFENLLGRIFDQREMEERRILIRLYMVVKGNKIRVDDKDRSKFEFINGRTAIFRQRQLLLGLNESNSSVRFILSLGYMINRKDFIEKYSGVLDFFLDERSLKTEIPINSFIIDDKTGEIDAEATLIRGNQRTQKESVHK